MTTPLGARVGYSPPSSARVRCAATRGTGRGRRKRPDVGAETKVGCEVGPRPDPMSLWARGKRPVQDGAVVLIQASGGDEVPFPQAGAPPLGAGPRPKN